MAEGMTTISMEWRDRLQAMFGLIAEWQSRVEKPPVTPVASSSLAADDQAFSGWPASKMAYGGLLSAVEHLYLFRSAYLATNQLYPVAYYTVLRSALMGAAQAVWILKGPRKDRIRHALLIVIDDINQQRRLLGDLGDLSGEQRRSLDQQSTRLAARLAKAETAAAAVGQTFKDVGGFKLNMIDVIKGAFHLAYPQNTPEAKQAREGAGLLWRMTSGHAHGTPSSRVSLINRNDLQEQADGTFLGRADAPIEHIGGSASAVVGLAVEAWRHYDLRCQPHAT